MKSDKLKDLIDTNREAFDSFEPSDLWQSISKGMSSQPAPVKSTLGKAWIKYGLSSLVIGTAATYFVVTSQQEKKEQPAENTAVVTKAQPVQEEENKNFIVADTLKRAIEKQAAANTAAGKATEIQETALPVTAAETQVVFEDKPMMPPAEDKVVMGESKPVHKDSIKLKPDGAITDTSFSGIKRIIVKSSFCDVNMKSHPGNDVMVHGKIKVEAKGIKFNVQNNYHITYEKKDSVLSVVVSRGDKKRSVVIVGVIKSEAHLDFEIPAGVEVSVDGTYGDMTLEGLSAKTIDISTTFGDIKAEKINADIKLKTSSGDIRGNQITGTVISESHFGDQRFESIEGDMLTRSSSGDVVVKQIHGKVNAKTTFGDQVYEMMSGDLVSSCVSGSIKLNDFKGHLKAMSRFGDIKGKNVEVLGDTDLETSSGDINIDFANDLESMGFNLQTSSGDLTLTRGGSELHSEKSILITDKNIMVKGVTRYGDQHYK